MASGTLSLTNGSTTVTGDSTAFTVDVSATDYLMITTGGISYLLGVISIQSDTQLTLAVSFDGPTVSGVAYDIIDQTQLVRVPVQLINQTSRALREMQQNEANWNQLLTVDGEVTITNPDGTQTTGPSWPAVSKGIDATNLDRAQQIADQTSASADAAATSETNAKASEDAAAQSASDAADSATDSATSAEQSANSASSISQAVTQSAQNAADASNSATRAEAAAEALENNNALAESIDHIDEDTHDVFFKGAIASGAQDASTELRTLSDGTGTVTSEIVQTDSSGDDPVTKTWTMPDDEGQLITLDDTGIASASNTNITTKGTLSVGTDASKDSDVVTLRQLNTAISGVGGGGASLTGVMNNYLGSVSWFSGTAALLPVGYVAASGQTGNRSDFPDLWNAIDIGMFAVTNDDTWLGNINVRGSYSTGDGSTTFRFPDYNGAQSNSIQGVFLRGALDGLNSGAINSSAIPNARGAVNTVVDGQFFLPTSSAGGSLAALSTVPNSLTDIQANAAATSSDGAVINVSVSVNKLTGTHTTGIALDLADSSAVYNDNITEVRPPSASGIWIIRVNGRFSASDTNFNVINGDESDPGTGVVSFGGDLRSVYQLGGIDFATLAMRPRVTFGTGVTGEIRLIDASTSTIGTKTWTMPGSEGQLVAVDSNGSVTIPNIHASQAFELNNGNDVLNLSFSGSSVIAQYSSISGIDFNGLWVHTATMSVNSNINFNPGLQGMHFAWNETGGTGEGDIIINRGGGTGGLHIRVVNSDNTVQTTAYTFSADGILDCQNGVQSVGGRIRSFTDVGSNQVMLFVDGVSHTINLADSDERLKEDIIDCDEDLALSIIENIHPVCFRFKDYTTTHKVQDETGQFVDEEITVTGKFHRFGVIAQELEEILPEAVNTNNDELGYKSIDTMEMMGLLIAVAHSQQKTIKTLNETVNKLSDTVDTLSKNQKTVIDALLYLGQGNTDEFNSRMRDLWTGVF